MGALEATFRTAGCEEAVMACPQPGEVTSSMGTQSVDPARKGHLPWRVEASPSVAFVLGAVAAGSLPARQLPGYRQALPAPLLKLQAGPAA